MVGLKDVGFPVCVFVGFAVGIMIADLVGVEVALVGLPVPLCVG